MRTKNKPANASKRNLRVWTPTSTADIAYNAMLEPVKPNSMIVVENLIIVESGNVIDNASVNNDPTFHSITRNKKVAKNWFSSLRTSFHKTINKKPNDNASVKPLESSPMALKNDIVYWTLGTNGDCFSKR